jgi:type III secretion system YscQ/HrcQ family protein
LASHPFPYAQLPQLTRHEARAASLLARGVPGLSLTGALDGLERPLGERPRIQALPVETWPAGSALARPVLGMVGVVIADGVHARSQRMVIELDEQLAGYVVDRALGASGPEPRLSPGPVTGGERGTLAYLGASALRHAKDFRVIGVVTTIASFAHALGDEASGVLFALPARIQLAALEGWARVWVPPSRVHEPASGPLDGELPVELALLGGTATLSAGDVASLDLGDVVVPEHWSARPTSMPDTGGSLGVWQGVACAVSVHGGPALRVALGTDVTLLAVERGPERTSRSGSPSSIDVREGALPGSHDMSENAVPAAEIPVELSVELGRLTMSVGELSALVAGSVLVSGIPAGQPVTLRAGAKIIARGELVVVDGELGVRIASLG